MKKSDRALTDGRDVQLFDCRLGFVARFLDPRGHVPRPCSVVRSWSRSGRTSVDRSRNVVGLFLHAGDRRTTTTPVARTLTAGRHDRTNVPRPCSGVRSWNHDDRSCRQTRADRTPWPDVTAHLTAQTGDRSSACGQLQTRAGRLSSLTGRLTGPSHSATSPLRRHFRSSLRCSIDDRHVVPRPESNVRVPSFDGLHRRFH